MKNVIHVIMLSTALSAVMSAVSRQENKAMQVARQAENEESPLQTRDYEEFLDEGCCEEECSR